MATRNGNNLAVMVAGAAIALGVSVTSCRAADAPSLSTRETARTVTVSQPFKASEGQQPLAPAGPASDIPAAPGLAPPPMVPEAGQPAAPPAWHTPATPPGAPGAPGANDGLYLDWVSPLQSPRGLVPTDFAPPSEAFLEPGKAGPASDAPLSIPETSTIGLIGTALLPMLGLFFRRRT